MEKYAIVKSVLMLAALIAAFSLFSIRLRRLYRLMRSVQGRSTFTLDRLKERLVVLLTDVVGQANVRRKVLPGLAHTMIFFGFLAVQPHSLELMIKGVPGLRPAVIPASTAAISSGRHLAALVLVGLLCHLPPGGGASQYLTLGADANLILLFTGVIIITFQFSNAFQTLLPAHARLDNRGVFPSPASGSACWG
jgi:hypothetical protein